MTAKHTYRTLDAMRGVAAIAVVIFHFNEMLEPLFFGRTWFGSGYLAVDLFFVLSGFVIAHAYDRRLANGMTLRDFALKRLIRFAPMIWIGLLIGLPHALLSHPDYAVWLAAAANALILPSPVSLVGTHFPINVPEWSLFYEMTANLAFAALFSFVRGWRLFALIGLSAIGIVVAASTHGRISYFNSAFYLSFARVGCGFLLGIAMYRYREMWSPKVPRVSTWVILVTLFAALAFPIPLAWRWVFDPLFILLAAPALVMLASQVEPSPTGARLSVILATISYPIYAFHGPVRDWAAGVTAPVAIAIIFALIPASLALARFYDEPVRRFLTRITKDRAAVVPG